MILIYAYLLDLLLGDPQWSFHPVRLIGKTISTLEGLIRKRVKTSFEKRIGGGVLLLLVVLLSFITPYLLIGWLNDLSRIGGYLLVVFLSYTALSSRGLYQEAAQVLNSLENGNLEEARSGLSMIVGRDTTKLSDEGILRAIIETVSENTSDGMVAPIFYLVLGGVPLAFLYKAVNTLDCMVGYKESKYIDIGWASARTDDILNYVPARLTALLMVLSSYFLGLNWRNSWRILMRDRRRHPSPNAGCPEAAVAGALQIRLGGGAYYFGRYHPKPTIGDGLETIDRDKVLATLRLMHLTSFVAVLSGALFLSYIPWNPLW